MWYTKICESRVQSHGCMTMKIFSDYTYRLKLASARGDVKTRQNTIFLPANLTMQPFVSSGAL